ncbi:MAG: NAD(+)/NADH kinase [Elusimicrobiota bacterium]|nr:NAD(+)/NADH kinase [Elusimicrobiota bacterium]
MNYSAGIIYNKSKANAKKLAYEIADWLKKHKSKGFVCDSVSIKPRKFDFVLSIGGDGTMLKCIRTFAPLNTAIKGINLGSLGFLTDTDTNQVWTLLKDILDKDIKVEKRALLCAEFKYQDRKMRIIAANDFVIRSTNAGKIITVDVSIDKKITTEYKCDGMIVATPTGSTAYSLAALGPIVYPDLSVFILNPISPHTLTQRPMILSNKNDVFLSAYNKNRKGNILISVDGQDNYLISDDISIRFSLYKKPLRLIKNCSRPYFETLKKKLNWGL